MESLIENAEVLGEKMGWILDLIPKDLAPEGAGSTMEGLLPAFTAVVDKLGQIVTTKAAEQEARTVELDKRELAIQEKEGLLTRTIDNLSSHAGSLERTLAVVQGLTTDLTVHKGTQAKVQSQIDSLHQVVNTVQTVTDEFGTQREEQKRLLEGMLEEVNKSIESHQGSRALITSDQDALQTARREFRAQEDELRQELRRQDGELRERLENHERDVVDYNAKVGEYRRILAEYRPQIALVDQVQQELADERARVTRRDQTVEELTTRLEESRQQERSFVEALNRTRLTDKSFDELTKKVDALDVKGTEELEISRMAITNERRLLEEVRNSLAGTQEKMSNDIGRLFEVKIGMKEAHESIKAESKVVSDAVTGMKEVGSSIKAESKVMSVVINGIKQAGEDIKTGSKVVFDSIPSLQQAGEDIRTWSETVSDAVTGVQQAGEDVSKTVSDAVAGMKQAEKDVSKTVSDVVTCIRQAGQELQTGTKVVSAATTEMMHAGDGIKSERTALASIRSGLEQSGVTIKTETEALTNIRTDFEESGDRIKTESTALVNIRTDLEQSGNRIKTETEALTGIRSGLDQSVDNIKTETSAICGLRQNMQTIEGGIRSESKALVLANQDLQTIVKTLDSRKRALSVKSSSAQNEGQDKRPKLEAAHAQTMADLKAQLTLEKDRALDALRRELMEEKDREIKAWMDNLAASRRTHSVVVPDVESGLPRKRGPGEMQRESSLVLGRSKAAQHQRSQFQREISTADNTGLVERLGQRFVPETPPATHLDGRSTSKTLGSIHPDLKKWNTLVGSFAEFCQTFVPEAMDRELSIRDIISYISPAYAEEQSEVYFAKLLREAVRGVWYCLDTVTDDGNIVGAIRRDDKKCHFDDAHRESCLRVSVERGEGVPRVKFAIANPIMGRRYDRIMKS